MIRYLQQAVVFLRDNPKILAPMVIVLGMDLLWGAACDARLAEYGDIKEMRDVIAALGWGMILASLVATLIDMYLSAVFLRALYCTHSGQEWDWRKVGAFVGRRFVRLFLAGLLMGLAVAGGMILLIIPGVYISIRLLFYQYAIIFDDDAVRPSFKRSWKTTQGIWWPLFGILALFLILTGFIAGLGLWGTLLSFPITACFSATLAVWYLDIRKRQAPLDALLAI